MTLRDLIDSQDAFNALVLAGLLVLVSFGYLVARR